MCACDPPIASAGLVRAVSDAVEVLRT
jgi:hypothetical protein